MGLLQHSLCRDQRYQQGFGQSHRWIKTGTFLLIKNLKRHPGEQYCPAKQAISRPQGDVKATSAIVGGVCQRSKAAGAGTHAEAKAGVWVQQVLPKGVNEV